MDVKSLGFVDGEVNPLMVTVEDEKEEKAVEMVTLRPLIVQEGEHDIDPMVNDEAKLTTRDEAEEVGVNTRVSPVAVASVVGLKVPLRLLIAEAMVFVTFCDWLLE